MADAAAITGNGPVASLDEICDLLDLALDATERRNPYTTTEREARSYIRAARRQALRLVEAWA